jgi:site-specific recombinase XerD
MTLADVLKVKKLADNVSFLRLYFLKSQHAKQQLEIVDCTMAIWLFELTRAARS